MRSRRTTYSMLALAILALGVGYLVGVGLPPAGVEAAGGKVSSPIGTAPDRYAYYPGTEELKPDEIRLIAAGTGMPGARRGQAATCFLVELGDGQRFLFDIGTGAMRNVQALMIPANFLTKIFLTHLHTDHWGDLGTLWAGGWTAGRTVPLDVWGPSGAREDMGTKYAVDHFLKAFNWDYMTRAATINPIPGAITVHEFDYKGMNAVVYDEKGVKIRSWPTIHSGDGPVSYALEWNGYKVVIGGDTAPNKWEIEYAKDADLFVHEAFMTSDQMMNKYGQPAQLALRINFTFHTSAQSFGKIMSLTQPRHAVAYHFYNEEDTRYPIFEGIRETYDGPLSMATDNMVWNIRRDEIIERMVISPDNAWDVEGPGEKLAPDRTRKPEYTPFILAGAFDMTDVNKSWSQDFIKANGLPADILEADRKK